MNSEDVRSSYARVLGFCYDTKGYTLSRGDLENQLLIHLTESQRDGFIRSVINDSGMSRAIALPPLVAQQFRHFLSVSHCVRHKDDSFKAVARLATGSGALPFTGPALSYAQQSWRTSLIDKFEPDYWLRYRLQHPRTEGKWDDGAERELWVRLGRPALATLGNDAYYEPESGRISASAVVGMWHTVPESLEIAGYLGEQTQIIRICSVCLTTLPLKGACGRCPSTRSLAELKGVRVVERLPQPAYDFLIQEQLRLGIRP